MTRNHSLSYPLLQKTNRGPKRGNYSGKHYRHPTTGAARPVLEPLKNSNPMTAYYKRTRPKSKQKEGFNNRKTRKQLTDE